MADCWYFLSYSSVYRGKYLDKFGDELDREIAELLGVPSTGISFRDTFDIRRGDDWPERLLDGVAQAKVFVPLYSPHYFRSDYCGREWQLFSLRVNAGKAPILPVLWKPLDLAETPIPRVATRIQYLRAFDPPDYKSQGMGTLVQARRGQFSAFVREFAKEVIQAGRAQNLGALNKALRIDQVPSAFGGVAARGPRSVQVIFVAGSKSQMNRARKTAADYYGAVGGTDWRPFHPEPSEIGKVTEQAALAEGFDYSTAPADQTLATRLRTADRENSLVVMIADPWSTRVSALTRTLRQYGRERRPNCGMLVPWNWSDPDASAQVAPRLAQEIRKHAAPKADGHFVDLGPGATLADFEKSIRGAFHEIRQQMIRSEQSRTGPGDAAALPIVSGPGGA